MIVKNSKKKKKVKSTTCPFLGALFFPFETLFKHPDLESFHNLYQFVSFQILNIPPSIPPPVCPFLPQSSKPPSQQLACSLSRHKSLLYIACYSMHCKMVLLELLSEVDSVLVEYFVWLILPIKHRGLLHNFPI